MVNSVVGAYNQYILHVSFYNSILATIINFILFISLLQRRNSEKIYMSFASVLLGFFIWNIFSIGYLKLAVDVNLGFNTAETLSPDVLKKLYNWSRWNTLGLLVVGISSVNFLYYFTYEKYRWINTLSKIMIVLSPAVLYVLFSPWFETPVWALFSLLFVYFPGILSTVVYFRESKKNENAVLRKRNQYLFWASLIIVVGGFTNVVNGFIKAVPPLANIVYLLYIIVIFYMITETHLFRIKNAMKRIYIFLSVATVYTVIAVLVFLHIVYTESLEIKYFIIFIYILSAVFLYDFFYMFFARLFKYPLKGYIADYIESISGFYEQIVKATNISEVLRSFIGYVCDVVGIEGGALYTISQNGEFYILRDAINLDMQDYTISRDHSLIKVFEENKKLEYLIYGEIQLSPWIINNREELDNLKKWMRENDIEIIFPIVENDIITSFIVLGRKKGGFTYDEKDIGLVRILFASLRLAVKNMFLNQRIKKINNELSVSRREMMKAMEYKLISEVIAGVIHDFKNILGSAKGRIDLLKFSDEFTILPQAIKEQINSMDKSISRAIQLSKRFLDFTKDVRDSENFSYINLKEFIERLFYDWKSKSVEEEYKLNIKIDISIDIPDDLVVFFSDVGLMRILDNLVYNAIEAIGEKGENGRIDIWASRRSDNMIEIKVKDTGIGIPDDVKKNIFSLFFTTKKNGTGVGLSTAKGLLNAVGGSISFDSKYGEGTVFTVVLPSEEKKK